VALLKVADGLEVVGEAADGIEAIDQFRTHQPAVTLIDLRLPSLAEWTPSCASERRRLKHGSLC